EANRTRDQHSAAASGPDPSGALALLLLRAVPAAGLLAVLHTLRVSGTADDLVAHTGEVLHTAATNEHDRVLLQVVALTRDVGRDLDATGELDTSDLAQCRVGLLRSGGVHAGAHTTTLRAPLERRTLGLRDLVLAALSDQLLDGGHGPAFCQRSRLYGYSSKQRSFELLCPWRRAPVRHCVQDSPAPRGRACRPLPGLAAPWRPDWEGPQRAGR